MSKHSLFTIYRSRFTMRLLITVYSKRITANAQKTEKGKRIMVSKGGFCV